MATEIGVFIEWKLENFSHWNADVHGESITSPQFYYKYCDNMELFPKGIDGLGDHLVLFLRGKKYPFSGDLSFYCSDGSLLCKHQVNAHGITASQQLPPGPKFEDVLSRIGEGEDFITVILRIKDTRFQEQRMCTTMNVFKTSLKIHPRWIKNNMKPDGTEEVCLIQLFSNNFSKRMQLKTCSKNSDLEFVIMPPTNNDAPFAVEVCMCLRRSDGTVDGFVKKRHAFCNSTPWTFLDSMNRTEFVEKGISLFLIFKITTGDLIQSPFCVNFDYNDVSFEPNDIPCFPKKASDPATSISKIADSVKVLSEDFMCLYQHQDFADLQLKCDNTTFPVHRAILTARSPVFKTMLSTDMTESASGQVVIDDLDPGTLGIFLTYLYTGTAEEMECDSALKLYYAADKYQVPSLKKGCSDHLCSNVSISNVCDVLSLADKHQDDKLTSASQDFILDNFNAVLNSKEWDTLKKRDPVLVANTLTQFAAEDRIGRKHTLM